MTDTTRKSIDNSIQKEYFKTKARPTDRRNKVIPSKTLDALTEGREGFNYDAEGNFSGAGGEKSIDLLRLHYLYSSMKLELKTGIKFSRNLNTLKVANQMLGTNYKRKAQAFEHLESIMKLAGELKETNDELSN